MAENLILDSTLTKEELYQSLVPQIRALVEDEPNRIANMANVAAVLREAFAFFWVGFYLVDGNELILGPFQGPVACTRIPKGKGVCGTAWAESRTQIVDDVDAFPGHIACSAASKSEIVIPIVAEGKVTAILDIDSDQKASFDAIDQQYLEEIVKLI